VKRTEPGKKRVALTFDGGAAGDNLPTILLALRKRGIQITMFVTGEFVEKYPQAVKQAAIDGHELSNHTYSHRDVTKLTDEEIKDELARTDQIIRNVTGASTRPYWRPPYGSRNDHALNVAASRGYRSIMWTLDSLDSVGKAKTADFIFSRVTNPSGINLDGAIILQHIGADASAEALPAELDRLHEMGLKVVTISEMLSP
jgi:peptidoglycan/xylan/chitin deacetylase (PgdA/CDA1 family)